jgi:carbon-monoxide dehydrogenase large subunit
MPDDIGFDARFAVGQPVLRSEDPRLLTGGGRYTDDVSLPGQAHAYLLRSTLAHGRITRIDTARAAKSPGVLAVYTGKDLAADGIGGLPNVMPLKGRDGNPLKVPNHPAIAIDRVRHVGDPLALVVAETLAQAKDAAELIDVEIEALPVVTDMTRAAGAPILFDEIPNNLCLDFLEGDPAATDAAFAKAAHVTRLRLENNRVVANAMEPRAAVAAFDKEQQKFTIYSHSQGAFGLRGALAGAIFKLPPDKVRVISGDVGGSFGTRGQAYDGTVAAMFAARKLGRPVKWCADRQECFVSDQQGRASLVDAELALDADGNFLAIRLTGWGDTGAYVTAMGPAPFTAVLSRNLPSVYRTRAMAVAMKAMFTNTVPTGPYRGAGRPESKYVMERLVDQAAREMGIDRIELRRRNLVGKDEMPYKTPNGPVYDSGDFVGCLNEAVRRSDWAGFPARRRDSESRGKLRGIGVACYLEHTAPPGKELADVRFNADGTVTLICAGKDFGMGHATPFSQVLSQALGIPFEAIRFDQSDTDQIRAPGGSGGSRSAIASSGAILQASGVVIENGKKLASHVLEAAVEDIEFQPGRFRVAGTDRTIGIMELAAKARTLANLPAGVPNKLDAWVSHDTSPSTFPNGAHICEVEVDPDTGETAILRYTVVDDFGTMINPMIVEGQVHGGIAQGVGQALLERTVYDDNGQLLTGSLMDYCLPRADNLPSIAFATRPVPAKTNPLGLKGCGEAGTAGSLGATPLAVLDALATRGVTHLDTPFTPERIWQALQDAKARR